MATMDLETLLLDYSLPNLAPSVQNLGRKDIREIRFLRFIVILVHKFSWSKGCSLENSLITLIIVDSWFTHLSFPLVPL